MWGNPSVIYDIQCVTDTLCKRKHWDLCLFGRGKGHFVLETVRSKTSPVLMFPSSRPTNWMITLNSVVQRQDYFRFKEKAWYGLCWLQSNDENENKQTKTYSSKPLISQAHFSISGTVPSQPVYTEKPSDMNANFTPKDGGLRIETLLWSMQCTVWQKDQIPMFLNKIRGCTVIQS